MVNKRTTDASGDLSEDVRLERHFKVDSADDEAELASLDVEDSVHCERLFETAVDLC